jgi:segregation and condensation protein B
MSLKAKLEAVIYAVEEPVTLTQLAQLFAAEALEWKATQEAAAAEQAAEVAGDVPAPSQQMLAEGLEYLGMEDTPAVYTATATDPSQEADRIKPELAKPWATEDTEDGAETVVPKTDSLGQPPAHPLNEPLDTEAEAKRLARQRERDVRAILRQLLDELIAECATDDRGLEIREIAGGYRMATKPEFHDVVRMFVKSLKTPMKLSLPALETLAVIAYKQPVTAPK